MIHQAFCVTLIVCACFAAAAPMLARRMPPAHATWLLSTGAVILALSAIAIPALLGWTLIGQIPDIAARGHWSTSVVAARSPATPAIAAIALIGVTVMLTSGVTVTARRLQALRLAYRSCRELPGSNQLVVLPHAPAGACAIPGRPGRIIVARSLLADLPAKERSALLAHERAHLAHGHHWHQSAVVVSSAINPLLLPLRAALTHALERWADEVAADTTGNRQTVAVALARTALLVSSPPPLAATFAAAGGTVSTRIVALLVNPPRSRPLLVALIALLLLLGVAAAITATKGTERLFEAAMHAYHVTHHR